MKLTDLRFDTPSNTCLSLHVLAEMARAGDVTTGSVLDENGALNLSIAEKNAGRIRRTRVRQE